MNISNLLFEPYTIILMIAIILTIVAYFIVSSDNKDKEEENQTNMGSALLYTFLGSFIGMVILKFGLQYLNNNNIFQKGGTIKDNVVNPHDMVTVVADDIEVGFMET